MDEMTESDAPATPRHRAEARASDETGRYRDILRASVDWLWSCDRGLVVTGVAAPTAAGERPVPNAPIGQPLKALLAGEANAETDELPASVRARRPFRDLPGQLGGEAVLLSGVPTYDANGRFAGYQGSARGAELRQSDAAAWALLREFEQLLMRSNEAEWRLGEAAQRAKATRHRLACLLHELRTPLNAVSGYAELAQSRLGTGATQAVAKDLERLREASAHMTRMVQGFERGTVDAAQSSGVAWTREEPRTTTRLDAAMSEAVAMIELNARKAGVRVHAPPSDAADAPAVRADQRTVMQILVNLLGNAVKFTPAGGEVGMTVADTADDRVRVAVWDTGPGIAAEEIERIFERSYRGANGQRRRGANENVPDGQGLGLSIARDLARAAGGELTVESRAQDGAVFYLDLPAAADGEAEVTAYA